MAAWVLPWQLHNAGLNVIATARNPDKMVKLKAAGIETMSLDILSQESINEAVDNVSSLDILVNNAGTAYSMPFSDRDIEQAKETFDTNVWAQLAITQAFLPLLLKSKGMIVNQTSVVSTTAPRSAIFSDTARLELAPFGIKVIEPKTGAVSTNMIMNQKENTQITLPAGSLYEPAREAVESAMRNDKMGSMASPADRWAAEVVGDLMKKNPPAMIWSYHLINYQATLPENVHGMVSTFQALAQFQSNDQSEFLSYNEIAGTTVYLSYAQSIANSYQDDQ
ncbi:putative short-chain dehydrogenases/ reductase [Lipomyces kononenkoae]|uniref:Short-chain dehydrogenases/ reductase n=1 Tax=Lipomyces kononenkoae TaxID=34357 RepID=A0ACC3T6H0_LIPKO